MAERTFRISFSWTRALACKATAFDSSNRILGTIDFAMDPEVQQDLVKAHGSDWFLIIEDRLRNQLQQLLELRYVSKPRPE